MNSKNIFYLIIFVGLFGLSPSVIGATINSPIGYTDFNSLIANIATQVGTLISSVAVVMFIVAGCLYLTSAGSPERIGTAKKALVAAIIGLAIGLAASSIASIVCNIM